MPLLKKHARCTASLDRMQTLIVWIAIGLGVATCFMGENFVPATHFVLGNVLRYGVAGAIFSVVVWQYKSIISRLSKIEKILIAAAFTVGMIAVLNSYILNTTPNPFYFAKLIILNICIYLLAKLVTTKDQFIQYLKVIYYVGCFASIQAFITLLGDLYEVYYVGEVVLPGIGASGNVILPFWGLTGAHHFMRSFWYFSESAYFAQFLLVGLGYAIAMRRTLGIAIITVGVVCSFALLTMIAGAIMLCTMTVFSRGALVRPISVVFVTIISSYLIIGNFYIKRATEGITTRVLSIEVVQDMIKKSTAIDELEKQKQQLSMGLSRTRDTLQHRRLIESKLQKINDEIIKNELVIKGNLRGNSLVTLKKMLENNTLPVSKLVPSDSTFYRGGSKIDKINSLNVGWSFLLQNPVGGGMESPSELAADGLNSSPGWVGLTLVFGCLWLVVFLPIYGFIIKNILFSPYDHVVSTLMIVLGSLFLSTFWHGPHLTYSMVFLLSALVTLAKYRAHSHAEV
jgi:hypothetical protein